MAATVEPALPLETVGLRLTIGMRVLIDALDWRVLPGQLWCVLGPNGAGKTTLLRHAGRLPAAGATTGTLRCFGVSAGADRRERLARVRGYMPQQQDDAFDATVIDAALIGRHPHLGRWQWEGRDDGVAALDALARVGMAHAASRSVRTLSGGERQRVALATVLLQAPRLYLLDEPLSHQDLGWQERLTGLFTALAREGAAVVATLHDVNLAARAASHVLLLDGAGGALAGPVDEVLTAHNLGTTFGRRMRRLDDGRRGWFVPD